MYETEQQLKDFLAEILYDDFMLIEEAKGRYCADGRNHGVRIDFIAKAKPHLIKVGFPDKYFGIEVKHLTQSNYCKKQKDLYAQCLVYRRSIFQNRGLEPFAVFEFSNMNIFKEYIDDKMGIACLENLGLQYQKDISLTQFASRFNVGEIQLILDLKGKFNYKMMFGHHKFFVKNRFGITCNAGLLGSFTGSDRKHKTH